jgi:hypothetical protein
MGKIKKRDAVNDKGLDVRQVLRLQADINIRREVLNCCQGSEAFKLQVEFDAKIKLETIRKID